MPEKRIIKLYENLPAVYRLRDAERGYPLRGLIRILEEQADLLKRDIDGLWDDFFIETCADWVIPYIGDLVGNNPLHEATLVRRADVAKTLYYRRRKGVLPMLEELARDVTGWGVHAVEFFRLLGWNQNLNHVRYRPAPNPLRRDPPAVEAVGTVHLRDIDALDRLDGPFDRFSHSADIRPIAHSAGWHNIRNVGFFVWRLESYPLRDIPATPSEDVPYGWYFSPLGAPALLFNNPEREASPTGLATELHVPDPIRPIAFSTDLENYRLAVAAGQKPVSEYYGENLSLTVTRDGTLIEPQSVVCVDLSEGWGRPQDTLHYLDPDGNDVAIPIEVGVDPATGRLVFPTGKEPAESLSVYFHYGFSGDIGGGPYGRRATFLPPSSNELRILVSREEPSSSPPHWQPTVSQALTDWIDSGARIGVIEIADNGTYDENLSLELSDNEHLTLRAADGVRPLLRLVNATGHVSELTLGGGNGEDATLRINGLVIEGAIRVEADSLGDLVIMHSMLVPGRHLDEEGDPVLPEFPSITAGGDNERLQVTVCHSMVGPLRLAERLRGLTVKDSIIDAPEGILAHRRPMLVSGNLSPFPEMDPDELGIEVTMGAEGTFSAELSDAPASLAEARDILQEAIRGAHNTPAFTGAVVATVAQRLVVIPGVPDAEPAIEDPSGSGAATVLRLVTGEASMRQALISATLPSDLHLPESAPSIMLRMGGVGPERVELDDSTSTLAQAQQGLEQAIRNAAADPVFQGARVARYQDAAGHWRLAIIPGESSAEASVGFTSDDPETALTLRLRMPDEVASYALSAPGDGSAPGPPIDWRRTTVFGRVRTKQIDMASEVIFVDPVTVERQQEGCVRFSYVPDTESVTPQRYRCQPDLALAEKAEQEGVDSIADLPVADRALVRSRLRPTFTSIHYGDPSFGQLSLTCAEEIKTGAEDEAEMGVFNELKQPQREINLRVRLQEYLPFGLRPGIIRVT